MSEEKNQGTGFSEDYVKELRSEAAQWRTKFRELEVSNESKDVENELLRRGIEAEPQWVTKSDNQSVSDAVDSFLVKHPKFQVAGDEEITEIEREPKPKPMVRSIQQTNQQGPKSKGTFTGRTSEEIKKDPKARQALRHHYRELLATSGNRGDYSGE